MSFSHCTCTCIHARPSCTQQRTPHAHHTHYCTPHTHAPCARMHAHATHKHARTFSYIFLLPARHARNLVCLATFTFRIKDWRESSKQVWCALVHAHLCVHVCTFFHLFYHFGLFFCLFADQFYEFASTRVFASFLCFHCLPLFVPSLHLFLPLHR